ncbi:pre-mRNA-processing factor 19-like [Phymastichus coffea]|uniref:pre-mRNA-processing factor 19-like n=1 Tax=Phymastichus coffea TaxID=108790 RepID=UPI00273C524B|nr:pre-mRNA-processing factor 19-like [Phymastichus coffea]
MLQCALSKEVPDEPVVSPVSGSIFEKRVITRYVAENGVDPINGKQLQVEQLIEIKHVPSKPKAPSSTSIPFILKGLRDEYDAEVLSSFLLRQRLQKTRQETLNVLYQHDAVCRKTALLVKESTSVKEALALLKPQPGSASNMPQAALAEAGGIAMQPSEEAGITDDIIQKLQEKATVLTQERKRRGRSVPEDLLSQDAIKSFQTLASHPGLHSASNPGILALDIHSADNSRILTGGADKTATVFNKDTEQIVSILKGHTKKVSRVIYHPTEDVVMTASPDSSIRIWNVDTAKTILLMRTHDAPVTGLSLHPTGDYLLSSALDHCWAFSDIRSGRLLTKVAGQGSQPLTTAQFHPDGLIFGTGTADSQVKIWDLKEQSNVANFPGHSGVITAISFSENGYYLATAAEDSCVKLWDLRKLKNFKTLQLDESYEVKDICFDQSGTYLAVCGSDVRIYVCKQWIELKTFNDHTAAVNSVRFGKNAEFIASASMDRTLKVYGTSR